MRACASLWVFHGVCVCVCVSAFVCGFMRLLCRMAVWVTLVCLDVRVCTCIRVCAQLWFSVCAHVVWVCVHVGMGMSVHANV